MPRAVAAALGAGDRGAEPEPRAAARPGRRGRRRPAPSSSSPRRRRGSPSPRRWPRSTSSWPRACSCRHGRGRAATASGTRSCARAVVRVRRRGLAARRARARGRGARERARRAGRRARAPRRALRARRRRGGDRAARRRRPRGGAARAGRRAARWFAAALRLLPAARRRTRRAGSQLLVPLATALAATGPARARARHAARGARADPGRARRAARAARAAACAGCENLLGRHARRPRRGCSRVLERAARGPARAACALHAELAADALFDTDFGRWPRWAERARAAADALGDPALAASTAAALLCFARYAQGDDRRRRARPAPTAAARSTRCPTTALAGRLEAPYYLGFAEYFCERYDDAIRHLRRGIAVSRAAGPGPVRRPDDGRPRARARGARAARRRRSTRPRAPSRRRGWRGNRQIPSWALVAEGWIAAMTGDSRAPTPPPRRPSRCSPGSTTASLTLADARARRGDLPRGRRPGALPRSRRAAPARRTSRASSPARRAGCRRCWRGPSWRAVTREAPRRWIERAERVAARRPRCRSRRRPCCTRRGALALRRRRRGRAAARSRASAAERADAVGADVHAARCAALAGRALAAAGDRDGAGALLEPRRGRARARAGRTACATRRRASCGGSAAASRRASAAARRRGPRRR